MKEQQIAQSLQVVAREKVPDSVDLWPAIEARLRPQEHRSRWEQLVPTTRLGWVFLSLSLILAFGVVTYAVSPAVARLFEQEPGMDHVAQADLVQEFAQSQTLSGITVTLERAYADANRIIVGFAIQDLDDRRRYEPHHLTLTNADGTAFRGTFGYGVTGQSDLFEISLPAGKGAYVYSFDASAVAGAPKELDLSLAVELEELALPSDVPGPSTTSTGSPMKSPQSIVAELQPMPVGAIVGPFTFDFSLPFIPGRTIEVRQTVEAAGIAITLEKVVIAPSETQATLCLASPDSNKEWLLVTEDGGEDRYGGTIRQLDGHGKECHRLFYPGALSGRLGRETLTVTELVGFDPTGQGRQTRLAGPWKFRFQVP